MTTRTARRLAVTEVEALDPYLLLAAPGKHVIHPDRGVPGVCWSMGTTAIEVARRYSVAVSGVEPDRGAGLAGGAEGTWS